jgi:hypothetical protein
VLLWPRLTPAFRKIRKLINAFLGHSPDQAFNEVDSNVPAKKLNQLLTTGVTHQHEGSNKGDVQMVVTISNRDSLSGSKKGVKAEISLF